MKILITIYNFQNLTGSEMYVYDLARELVGKGHDVTIGRLFGGEGEIVDKAREIGIKVCELYKIRETFDIIHSNETQPTRWACQNLTSPIVQTLHSELIEKYESPFISPYVKHYICVKESIYQKALKTGIEKAKLSVIYNGVDEDRFKKCPLPKGNTKFLFIGTRDYLRQKAAVDLVHNLNDGESVTFMGKGWGVGKDVVHPQVRFIDQKWNVENEIKQAHIVAGVLLGRSTIEGWLMGRKGLIYDIDSNGDILGKNIQERPKDYKKYSSSVMANNILGVYKKIINGKNS